MGGGGWAEGGRGGLYNSPNLHKGRGGAENPQDHCPILTFRAVITVNANDGEEAQSSSSNFKPAPSSTLHIDSTDDSGNRSASPPTGQRWLNSARV